MPLFLVQHGKSLPKEQDPQRGLSDEGRAEVHQVAAEARRHGVKVDRIVHSGKRRAEQTAEIFAAALDPANGIERRDGLKPLDDVVAIADGLDADDNLMLVGHLPFMELLAAYLVAGFTDRPVIRFRNGGIVAFDQEPERRTWHIQWTLVPGIGG
jgi:phosphohistidine phosphatase